MNQLHRDCPIESSVLVQLVSCWDLPNIPINDGHCGLWMLLVFSKQLTHSHSINLILGRTNSVPFSSPGGRLRHLVTSIYGNLISSWTMSCVSGCDCDKVLCGPDPIACGIFSSNMTRWPHFSSSCNEVVHDSQHIWGSVTEQRQVSILGPSTDTAKSAGYNNKLCLKLILRGLNLLKINVDSKLVESAQHKQPYCLGVPMAKYRTRYPYAVRSRLSTVKSNKPTVRVLRHVHFATQSPRPG